MDCMNQAFLTLIAGLILGIKHAFEADHLIAVSTIVTKQKNPLKAALIGTSWGFGHTITLFIIGLVVLLFKFNIPENISSFLVGLVHGLAGSGALMILVLSTISNTLLGIYYILIFGLGSIVAMTAISVLLSLPFIYSENKFPYLQRGLTTIAGAFSIFFGIFLMYKHGNAIIRL